MTFTSDIAEGVLFGNRILQEQYLQSGDHARHFRDFFLQAEQALGFLRSHTELKF